MQNLEYYNVVDRTDWPSDAWDDEPDKAQWQDPETGLPCLAVRHRHSGHWCGYVGVDESHPAHGKDYDDVLADVHGGLTFADSCQPSESEDQGICHVPGEGEPDHVWWLGFDCAHSGDRSPRDAMYEYQGRSGYSGRFDSYKSLAYVKSECRKLAAQLKELSTCTNPTE